MFSFLKGLLGQYKGYQRTQPFVPIVEDVKPATVNNVLQIPAIWQCVNKIAGTMATLPCDVLKVGEDGRTEIDRDCHLHYLLSERPNKDMTPFDFFRAMAVNYLIHGNAYARIDRARGADYVAALYPLNAGQVKIKVTDSGSTEYEYYSLDDTIQTFPAERILHWKNLGNGTVGLSLTEFARTTLTEAVSAQNASISLFANKGKINGILSADAPIMNKAQTKQFLEAFLEMRNANLGIPLLPSGFRFQQLAMSPVDTQLLQTREFVVKEFARWFGIPYALLSGDPGSDVDSLNNYFYKTTILPMCVGLEQVIMGRIVCGDPEGHRVKFRLSELNRATDAQRAQLNATYVQNGIKTRNEVRREEGLRDAEGGDVLTAQTNLAPIDQLSLDNFPRETTPQTVIDDTKPQKQ